MFGSPYPACEICGALYESREVHQGFHDLIGVLYQQAFGLTAEEYERNTGLSAAERDERITAAAGESGSAAWRPRGADDDG